jgi:hypothetical protein
MAMKRIGMGALALIAVIIAVGLLRGSQPAYAVGQQEKGQLYVNVSLPEGTRSRPLLVTVIKDGRIVAQNESNPKEWALSGQFPIGLYEVRVEGEGVQTLVKRGYNVVVGPATTVECPVHEGQGVKVVEYASSPMTRDEIAGRLAHLETAVEELRKKNP